MLKLIVLPALLLLLAQQTTSATSILRANAVPHKLEPDSDAWRAKLKQMNTYQNVTLDEAIDLGYTGHTRVPPWNREHLIRGMLAANPHQFRPLLDRLNRGEPINVLAYGSSVTQDFAGCFHTGPLGTLAKRIGADKLPDWHNWNKLQPQGMECNKWGGLTQGEGWGTMLMLVINATWPHPGHTFINAGTAACSIKQCVLNRPCIESHLPAQLDLLIFESYSVTLGLDLERTLWRIFSYYARAGRHRPAVVYIRTDFVAKVEQSVASDTCLRDGSQCERVCGHAPFNTTMTPAVFRNPTEYDVVALAQHYGFSVYSQRHFLISMLRDGVPQKLLQEKGKLLAEERDKTWGNMSTCRFLSSIYLDTIHPDPVGRLLLAEYVLDALADAQDFLAVAKSGDALSGPHLPAEPLYEGGHTLDSFKCTTMVDARSQPGRKPQPGEAAVLVTRAEGWHFSEYQVHGAHKKYKPGWVATGAAATLELRLSTFFPPSVVPDAPQTGNVTTVTVTYLESYEHMGIVRAECTSGCQCQSKVVDAHTPASHMSVANSFELVTQPPSQDCVISLTVQQETKSGEHKFKVLSVVPKKGIQTWKID